MAKKDSNLRKNTIFSPERMARRRLLQELFFDFYRSRGQIYQVNFIRGIFFGLGTALGGTLVVAFLIWLLSKMAFWVPDIADFIKQIIEAIE